MVKSSNYDLCICGRWKVIKSVRCANCVRKLKQRCVSVDGVIYESVASAARAAGLSKSTMRYRLRSQSFANHIYIERMDYEQ